MRNKADFGPAVVFLAEKAGLSQKQLAKAVKVHPKTVSAWKRGERMPNRSAMQALPSTLGCTMTEIETVAAFQGEWRQKMTGRQGRDVQEPRPEYRADADARHLEIGRTLDKLVDLLSPRPPGH
jgi:transcriptional regulator with XRE-family HTH domain